MDTVLARATSDKGDIPTAYARCWSVFVALHQENPTVFYAQLNSFKARINHFKEGDDVSLYVDGIWSELLVTFRRQIPSSTCADKESFLKLYCAPAFVNMLIKEVDAILGDDNELVNNDKEALQSQCSTSTQSILTKT